jgi:hypothetical protein
MAGRIFGYFSAVATELHAAPAAGGVLGCVMKVQNATLALTQALWVDGWK